MKNFQKFVTANERAKAFEKFCEMQHICTECPLEECNELNMNECRFAWLDLEADVDKPLPCPCCGADAEIHYEDDVEREGDASVQCKGCFLMTPDYPSDVEAVVAWNKRMSNQK